MNGVDSRPDRVPDVSFRYPGGGIGGGCAHRITFTAEPGEFVAIVGGTGTGKTLPVQLVPRLYDVTGRQVLIDGNDVREYPLRPLRRASG
jgi:ABC-type multidrug transport system fused ATPase/permease subunit